MRKKGMLCFLILSALLILLPTAGHLLPRIGGETSVDENRALAQWPSAARSLKIWLQSAESWLNDHLAFRDQLIEANLQMNLALGESPTSSVLLGRDGWLYLSEFDEARDVRREITLTSDEQDALVSRQTSLQELLKDGGAAYYVLIAPNKQTIYPEYLPLSLRPGVGETRLDQIYRTLAERTAVPFLDVRPALLAAKADQEVYYHYDHHWNETGGYYAFLALAQRLRQDFPTLYIPSPSEITTSPGTYPAGDVGRMIGLSGR